MLRTILLVLAFGCSWPAQAASATARLVDGRAVDITAGTVLVIWRLNDLGSISALRLADQIGQATGAPVVAINLDGATAESRLTPWLRGQGFRGVALADPDAVWQRRLGIASPGLVVVGEDVEVVARLHGVLPGDSPDQLVATVLALRPRASVGDGRVARAGE